jgi:hypothetical protein
VHQKTRNLIILITGILLFLTIAKGFNYTNKFGGTDLRCRTVGSRLLGTDKSPYFYKWDSSGGEFYLDPNDTPTRPVNGNVSTPAMLYMVYPVSILPYTLVRWTWMVLQFFIAFFALFLILKGSPNQAKLKAAIIVTVGLVCTDIWLLHIERGQVYIIYVLFFAMMYWLFNSTWKHGEFFSGLTGGLFFFFRPLSVVVSLGFLLQRRIKWILGYGIGLIFGGLVFVLPSSSLWREYFKAMNEYTNITMGKGQKIDPPRELIKPVIIEGQQNLGEYISPNIQHLKPIYEGLKNLGIIISKKQSILLYSAVLVILCFPLLRRKKALPPYKLFLLGFISYFAAELFLVAPRSGYSVIEWIFPVTLICLQPRLNKKILILLITGLLLIHNFPFIFPDQTAIAEVIFWGLGLYLVYANREDEPTIVPIQNLF